MSHSAFHIMITLSCLMAANDAGNPINRHLDLKREINDIIAMPRSCRMTALKPEHNKTAHCRTYFIQRQDDLICATEFTKTLGNFFYLYLDRPQSQLDSKKSHSQAGLATCTCTEPLHLLLLDNFTRVKIVCPILVG